MTRGPAPAAIHGTRAEYCRGCRCDPCRKANSEAQKAWRDRQKANGRRILHGYLLDPVTDDSDDLPTASRTAASWRDHAACRGVDPDLFFPGRGEATAPAKAVCATCPVRAECLNYAMANGEKFGIWGGLSERERRRLRSKRPDRTTRDGQGRFAVLEGRFAVLEGGAA